MLLSILSSALVAVLLILFVFADLPRRVRRHYRTLKLLRAIPEPSSFPPNSCHWLLGHIPLVYKQDEETLLRSLKEVNKPKNKDRSLAKLWLGPFVATIHVSHSRVLPQLLKEPKSELIYDMLVPGVGEGLLTSRGKKWFRNRRLLTPAFHCEVLKGYISVYNDCLSVLLDKWSQSTSKKEPVKLFDSLLFLSLDIILQCAFSFKSGCQRNKVQHPYVLACQESLHMVTDRIINPLYVVDWLYWLTPHGRKMKRLCSLVHQYAETVIADRKVVLGGTKVPRQYLDFLDILLVAKDEDGKGMTDLEIRNEVDTFMFGGHDTTTTAMSWTLYCLAGHPEHQDKVREEVRSVLMGREWLEYEDLKNLKYTTWCIKEAMRLYPPVVYFFRKTTDDIKLDDYLIPKGITIGIHTFVIHRNAHIWERPNEYDPTRFQPANMEKHGPYDYIPFSAGSRNCIGRNFAMNEMKVVVGTIVSRFSLRLDETHKVEMVPRMILKTKNDIQVLLEPAML